MKKLATIIFMTSIMLVTTTAFAVKPLLIDNFEDGNDISKTGGWWYTYNDAEDGGNSKVLPSPSADNFKPDRSNNDNQGYAAHMHGTAGNKLGWDYFGMGVTLSEKSGCPEGSKPVDLRKYSTLQFKIKGKIKGGRLTVIIPYTANYCKGSNPVTLTGWEDYEAAITSFVTDKWTTVKLNLRKNFFQPRWTQKEHIIPIEKVLWQLHTIEWHYSSQDGETADIWIDDIQLK
jgi:hypothetical protein